MAPTTGNDILGYTGNVGLGLNGDGQAMGLYGETNLDAANSAVFNLAYLNMQKNKAVYDQKIKDRDEGMKLISQGAMQVKNALPKDREKLMKMIDNVKKTYFDNNGDVKSDPRVWLKINDELSKFNEGANTAASRYVMSQNGMAEAAKETNPYKKKKMLEHWQGQQEKDLYEPFDPYQQTLDWDNGKVFRKMTETTTSGGVDKDNKYNKIQVTKTDLPESYRDFVNTYQQGDKDEIGLNVDTFLDSFYGRDGILTPESVNQKAQEVNNRLRDIATKEGFNPDDVNSLPEYLKPMKPQLLNGQVQSNDYKWNDWFKVMLYDQYKNKQESVFDKNLLAQAEQEAKIKTDDKNADTNRIRANAYADAQRANAGKARAQTKIMNEQETPAQNFDELKTKSQTVKTVGNTYVTRVNYDDVSENTRKFLGVDPLTAAEGKQRFVNVVPTKIVVNQNGKDETINDNDVDKYYSAAIKKGYQGSVLDYLNSVGAKYDIEVIGREKGKKTPTRSNRLNSYQNQTEKKTKSSLFLEDDNTPDEVDE